MHEAAAVGFERAAAEYERGRPGYPPAAIAVLARALGIGPGARVIDLAAGTGKLTRELVETGAELVAVEPVEGMRAQLRRAVPGVEVLDGTAEEMPLPAANADAVVVAQAFHWFDVPAAAREIRRVLHPGGGLGIIRNEWDRSVPWVDELQRLVRGRPGNAPRHPTPDWRARLDATGLFAPLSEEIVPNRPRADFESLVARIASLSFVAAMPDDERARVLAGTRALAERVPGAADGTLETPYLTHVLWTHALS